MSTRDNGPVSAPWSNASMPTWRYQPYPETLEALASVGRAVERERLRQGLSIRGLARLAGVAPSTILRLERTEIAASLLLVLKVARALGGLTIGRREPVAPTGNAIVIAREWERLESPATPDPPVAATGNASGMPREADRSELLDPPSVGAPSVAPTGNAD
jgi:transcriptional regulator with XRE-family HTH domain